MSEKKKTLLRVAEILLGVVIGVIITLTVVRYRENRNIMRAKYVNWQKLNLILDQIERNYVDTIDMPGMTDAAIVGSWILTRSICLP